MKFVLKCGAPKGSGIPDEAKNGFNVVVDRTTNSFSAPWWDKRQWPIASVGPQKVILMNDHVEHGLDGNPEDRRISFDLRTRTLHFFEAYSIIVPVQKAFSSHCKIANA